jgi:hypothetical protein
VGDNWDNWVTANYFEADVINNIGLFLKAFFLRPIAIRQNNLYIVGDSDDLHIRAYYVGYIAILAKYLLEFILIYELMKPAILKADNHRRSADNPFNTADNPIILIQFIIFCTSFRSIFQ